MSLQQTGNPNPKLFIIAKLLPKKLDIPTQGSGVNNSTYQQKIFRFIEIYWC